MTPPGRSRGYPPSEAGRQVLDRVREFITEEVLGQIAHRLGSADARLRATLVGSQIIGLAMARYIVKVEPLASAPPTQVVAAVGPTLQRYLTGDLADPAGGP